MSLIDTIKADLKKFFATNPVGQALEADAKIAWEELVNVAENDLKQIVEQMAEAALAVLASPAALSPQQIAAAAIAAGIDAAVKGFKAAGKDVTTQTLATLATTVANQVSAKAAVA